MSTRRARIKAVTSLPPRRKNVENSDNKAKQIPTKQDDEKSSNSPKPSQITHGDSSKSPSSKILSPLKSPRTSTNSNVEKALETSKVPTPVAVKPSTPKPPEKNPATTSTAIFKSDIFISPPAKFSPLKKHVPSPVRMAKAMIDNSNKAKTAAVQKIARQIAEDSVKSDDHNNSRKPDVIHDLTGKTMTENRTDVLDDYNVPSVPESIPEDAMDGIVPLQPAGNAPNPIALLKNEIISEYAEVLFDPIVPLPSPSKVRPKLRPAPRLAPLRRNSIQGSASESEDESRRALLSGSATPAPPPAPPRHRLDSHTSHSTQHSTSNREVNRVRNDSVCSSVGHAAPAPATSPVKEKHYHKTRRQEMSRRMAAMHRRKEAVKRDALTMYDLIFYNPVTKPFVPDQDEIQAKEANEKEAIKNSAKKEEDNPDDPPKASAAPVPQIKLGPNGEIMLDEKSLVIKQSLGERKVSGVVREGAWGRAGGCYRRTPRTADWSAAETVRFYRALAALGTDFTLMQPLFPARTRRDLKLKFKREEKLNGGQVDKALRTAVEWDAMRLQGEFTAERAEAESRARRDRERLQEDKLRHLERLRAATGLGLKTNKTTKILESSALPKNGHVTHGESMTANDIIQQAVREKIATRKRKPANQDQSEPLTFPVKKPTHQCTPPQQVATLTLINSSGTHDCGLDMASKVDPKTSKQTAENPNPVTGVPSNIETGSLVVLTVNDPNSPMKKMLQTYIAHGAGKLTPVNLPPTLLSSVVGYMKKGTPKSNRSARSSPSLTSPSSVASHDSRASVTPGVEVTSTPQKRQRHSSYTITTL